MTQNNGHFKFVEGLLEKGANPNRVIEASDMNPFSLNALGLATKLGETECVDILIKSKKCNLQSPFENLGSLLHVTIYFHQFEMLDHLLSNYRTEFDIEFKNHKGLTPLAFAASLGENECLGILYEHKASIESKDDLERIPIHHAAMQCHRDTIQLLAVLESKIEPGDLNRNRPIDLIKDRNDDAAKSCQSLLINLANNQKALKYLPTPHLAPPVNLVFKGGSFKVLADVGGLIALEEEQFLTRLERVAGTSAGAIIAAFLAINFPIKKIEKLIMETNLAKILLDHPLSQQSLSEALQDATKDISSVLNTLQTFMGYISNPSKLISTSIQALYKCTGICDGERFREWIEHEIKEKTEVDFFTFGELAEAIREGKKSYKHLHVYLTKAGINPQIIHIHSNSDEWKDVIISDAIRASMSIPGVFKPHIIHIKHGGIRIPAPKHGSFFDGGVIYNFPIETFDRMEYLTRESLSIEEKNYPKFNKQTIGFNLFSSLEKKPPEKNISTVLDLWLGICRLVYHSAEESIRQLNPYNASRAIDIDIHDVGTFDFYISDSKKQELIQWGQQGTKQFLEKHHLNKMPRLRPLTLEEVVKGPESWENHFGPIGKVFPIPKELKKIFAQPCPIWPNKKFFETHILMVMPSHLNGKKLNLPQITEKNPLFAPLEDQVDSENNEPYWLAITRNTIPGCYKMTFDERCVLISQYPNYEPPKLIEVAVAATFESLIEKQKLFPASSPSWMRWTQCIETNGEDHWCLGNHDDEGMKIFPYAGKAYGGIVAVRRFYEK